MSDYLFGGETSMRADRLAELEGVIARGVETVIEVGLALLEISEKRLYRQQGYETFEAYCRERWEWTRQRAYQLMDAARVMEVIAESTIVDIAEATEARDLCTTVHTPLEADDTPSEAEGSTSFTGIGPLMRRMLPKNEAQARELARLKVGRTLDEPAIQETWREAVEEHGDAVTAADVRAVVDARRNQRREAAREQRRQDEQQRDAILSVVGDPAGDIERARLAAECTNAIARFRGVMGAIHPALHVPLLDEDERLIVRELLRDVRQWLGEMDGELGRTLRLVSRNDDDNVG